jgi:uncharacterized membrane-anchored protein
MNRENFFKSPLLKYIAIAVLPLAALFYAASAEIVVLTFGESVLLEVVPIDPKDFLRGDYVTLDYKISLLDPDMVRSAIGEDNSVYYEYRGKEIFVTLGRDERGVGYVKSVSAVRPAEGLYLTGKFVWGVSSQVDYGIGVYYVPEGTGYEIERAISEADVLADVRVLRGKAVIKKLEIRGGDTKQTE